MALLFAAGMVLTLLKVTDMMACTPLALLLVTAAIAVLALGSLERKAALLLGSAAAAGGLGYLLLGGVGQIVEVMQALALHMSGLTSALPLVASRVTVLVSLLCGATAWFVTQRSAGAYPAMVLLLLVVVLLWLGDQTQALWTLLPAVIACVALLLRAGDDTTRTSRVLPLAAIVTLLSFTGVAIGGATIEPLKETADAIRQKIYDIFFFTDPRDVFTLASEGYYPQGQSQLGGPAEPREEPVMAVITPKRAYLRGVVKNVYTGRSWLDDTGGRRYLWAASRWQPLRSTTFDMALPQAAERDYTGVMTPYTLSIRMLGESASSMFVPQRLRSLEPEGDLTPYFNIGSEVFATRNLALGDVWTVEAPLYRADDAGVRELVEACGDAADENWADVNRKYRALPDHLEQAVFDIAYEAVAGADTPYEMAWALQQYLASNYTYTLDVDRQPPELDFVSTFLLLEKEGYCTYFASAMTVLCRMVGLPARYVEGYLATPDADGLAIVTGKEGHAWTEVYFKGFGWLTFDATPASAEIAYAPPQQPDASDDGEDGPIDTPEPTATPTMTPDAAPTPSPSPEADSEQPTPTPETDPQQDSERQTDEGTDAQDGVSRGGSSWPWLLLALLAAAAGRIAWTTPSACARRQKKAFGQWLVWVQAVHDGLRMMSLVRLPSESPLAFFERVQASGKLPVSLRDLGDMESLMFYGHAEPEPGEIETLRRTSGIIWRQLTFPQKALMCLQRAFMPRRSHDVTGG